GFGMDPMSILVPFLIFAIAVSHAVQMVSANRAEIFEGFDARVAARRAFRKLIVPGGAALAPHIIGCGTPPGDAAPRPPGGRDPRQSRRHDARPDQPRAAAGR